MPAIRAQDYTRLFVGPLLTNAKIDKYRLAGNYGVEEQQKAQAELAAREARKHKRKSSSQREQDFKDQLKKLFEG